jgi:hypothetical protein
VNGAIHVPNGTRELDKSPYTTPDGNELEYQLFRGLDDGTGSPAVRVRYLNLKTPGYTVNIALMQPEGKKETQILVNLW